MRSHAAQGWDTGHRDHLLASVQRAHATLDKAADGQRVPPSLINRALRETGDLRPFTRDELRLAQMVGERT